ncbi:MAG: hypothetical protein IJ769_01475 [Clostridia bacterium]|nr:hypothetical protein [Clostridia bacterium]
MKRMIALLLALLLCGAALAEGEAFSLREGVAWGMTPDEVLAIEKPVKYEVESRAAGAQVLEIEDLRLAGAEYDLDYWFVNGALVAMEYEFEAEDIAPNVISDALDANFGGREAGNSGRFAELMSTLTGRDFALTADLRAEDFFFDWTGEDGSYIALTNLLSDDRDDISVFHFDASTLLDPAEAALSEPAPALDPDAP